jgi:hypothetical protein
MKASTHPLGEGSDATSAAKKCSASRQATLPPSIICMGLVSAQALQHLR